MKFINTFKQISNIGLELSKGEISAISTAIRKDIEENGQASNLTKREYFAGRIATGICSTCDSSGEWSWHNSETVADVSVEVAEALIKRLNQ